MMQYVKTTNSGYEMWHDKVCDYLNGRISKIKES